MEIGLRIGLWTLIAGGMGALPLAWAIGRWGIGVEIRSFGDGNPGAMNVLRAGGWRWFLPALLLEFLKGAAPIALAVTFGVWCGLTEWRVPMLLGSLFVVTLRLFRSEGQAVRAGMLALNLLLGGAALVGFAPVSLWAVALGHTLLLFWTHRRAP